MIDNLQHRRATVSLAAVALCIVGACFGTGGGESGFPTLSGPYLGQAPPGSEPQLFAPGIVSTGMYERDMAMTPDGSELYLCVVVGDYSVIMQTRLADGRWTRPEVAPFSGNPEFMDLEPHISPDGQRFYFVSNRPADGGPQPAERVGSWTHADIWVMDRVGDGWGEPRNLGAPVNSTAPEFFPSITADGTLYFTREGPERGNFLYRARPSNGGWREPERLPAAVNATGQQFNGFIAPDERYLIFGSFGRSDSRGGSDYYIAFRTTDDKWTPAVNLGDAVNHAQGAEWSGAVSRDGRYFFFMATSTTPTLPPPEKLTAAYLATAHAGPQSGNPDIYWVDAGFLDRLHPDSLQVTR
jgi:hypothetical protein